MKLRSLKGPNEKAFWAEVQKDEQADVLRTCQLNDGEEARKQLVSDRKQVLDALNEHLIERFQKVLDDPVLKSMSVFDNRFWPSDSSKLEGINDGQIEDLYEAFKGFFEEHEPVELVVEQWNELQSMIIDNVHLMNRKFHDLWPYVLVHFHNRYPLPLRLVVISMLIVCDTSECERIFSLMNDIKTAERSLMGTRTLRNLMLWHRMARKVSEDGTLEKAHLLCRDVPVMEIIKAFRELAGEHGRRPHRSFPVPVYEYEKGRTHAAKEAWAKALAGQVPVVEKEPVVALQNAHLPQEMDAEATVDAAAAGGHFARWGEAAPVNLGPHAGEYLGIRRMGA